MDRWDRQPGLRPVHAVPAAGEGMSDGVDPKPWREP